MAQAASTLGVQSRTWPVDRLLLDVSALPKNFALRTEYALGALLAEHLKRLSKVALVTRPGHSRGAAIRIARAAGVAVEEFTSADAAAEWLAER